MNSERWQKIEEVFCDALERNISERAAFLQEVSGGDEELCREVESLLEAHQKASEFLEAPASDAAFDWINGEVEEIRAGEKIGPYQVIRTIGRGGMGAVFLASRADDQYRQQVAIKVMRPALDSDLFVERFKTERQILANLDHPNIARLLDGGTTEEGMPYLVMEYIEGLPIESYCKKHQLSIDNRLKLFRTVCSAVQYAHQHLVVHRDIKPANILVTEEGVPKLLDFGIAKLLSSQFLPGTELTRTGIRFMTPEYASPEQVRGEQITTSTDVYSLGVLLYKLLTGVSPYQLITENPREVERIICEDAPRRPSAALKQEELMEHPETRVRRMSEGQVSKLRRRLAGDVDNIVLKAMRKETQRRYVSVQQFSEDIQFHLEGKPVIARPDTIVYRAGKFVLRHKVGVSAAALVLLILIAATVITSYQAKVAAEQRDKARLEAEKVTQIYSFVEKMLSSADPEINGKDVTVAEILNSAAQQIETKITKQPEIQASLHNTIGMTYLGLGLYDQAESHLRSALQTRLRLFGRDNADVAMSMNNLAVVFISTGNSQAAEPLLKDAFTIMKHIHGEAHLDVARVLNNLGELELQKGDLDAAERFQREDLSLRRKLVGKEDVDLAESLHDLAVVLGTKGNLEQAERLHREALQILRKVRGYESPEVAIELSTLASVLEMKKDYSAALSLHREALAMRQKLLGNDHPLVAWTLYNYAYCLYETGEYAEAARLSRDIVSRRGKTLPEEHPMISSCLQLLGKSLVELGQLHDATPLLHESLEIRRKTLPANHWLIASSRSVLGDCLRRSKRFQEAELLLLRGYEGLKASLGSTHERTKEALLRLITLYQDWNKPEKAEHFGKLSKG